MKQRATLIREGLKMPRAAAIAGILFSVFLIAALVLFRLSVRADPLEAGGVAQDELEYSCSGIEPGTIRRHCVLMVHWCPARPLGGV